MLRFKDLYKGKRVFIIGNGPSLARTNLDLIKNEYSFAMNRIARIYSKTEWRPSFFICTSTNVSDEEWHKDILKSVDLGVPTFIWRELKNYFNINKNIFELNCTNGHEVTNNPSMDWWSDDIDLRVTKYGTSLIVAAQIAVYMGFKDIYLLGVDLGFKDSIIQKLLYRLGFKKIGHFFDRNHFFGSYGTPGCKASDLNMNMIEAHKIIKHRALLKGCNVYNATNGGKLEIYPRVKYETLF